MREAAGARATRTVIRQNVVGRLLVNTVGIAVASAGVLLPVPAALLHAVCDVVCLANASRLIARD